MLTLMILDPLHQVGLNLKLLRLHLRLEYDHVFILPGHLLLHVTAEAAHLRLYLLNDCAPIDHLRECIAHLSLGEDLVIADLMVASDHVLGSADDFVFENIETLL